jgi:ABC-2 type transport system permease protein
MNTTTMKWLLRRELWENKGSMFWAPLVVAALLVLFVGGTTIYGLAQHHLPAHITINGHTMASGQVVAAVPVETRAVVAQIASSMYMGAGMPLLAVLSAVVFFYCLGALYDERRDRSILFWKSLPVSDQMTVLSKVLTALVVAPLIALAFATIVSLALLFILCAAASLQGLGMFGPVLSSPDLYLSPLRVLALLPVYVVWALPTVGWLLLVSSWARTKPFLWAVGVPLVGLLILKWVSVAMANFAGAELSIMPAAQDVVARLLTGVVPGIWFSYHGGLPAAMHSTQAGVDVNNLVTHSGVSLDSLVTHSYATLLGADAWIGVAMGALMIFGAVRLRRWRDEG